MGNDANAAEILRGLTAVRTPGGGIAYLRSKPVRTYVPPSVGCTASSNRSGGGEGERPPRPGVQARRLGAGRLVVDVGFGAIPTNCTPDRVRITIDSSGDPLPPASLVYPVARVTTRPFVLRLPPHLQDADMISASSIDSQSGSFSDSDFVLIKAGSLDKP